MLLAYRVAGFAIRPSMTKIPPTTLNSRNIQPLMMDALPERRSSRTALNHTISVSSKLMVCAPDLPRERSTRTWHPSLPIQFANEQPNESYSASAGIRHHQPQPPSPRTLSLLLRTTYRACPGAQASSNQNGSLNFHHTPILRSSFIQPRPAPFKNSGVDSTTPETTESRANTGAPSTESHPALDLGTTSDSTVSDSYIRKELDFQIPEDVLRAALRASRSTAAAYFSHTLYRNPAGSKVLVQYCRSFQTSDLVARSFLEEEVLGFDVEWKPNASAKAGIKDNVSLIQIASPSRVALFHLAKFSGETAETLVSPILRQIMESDKILKAGVAISGDFTRIRNHLGIEGRGLIELSHLHNLVTQHLPNTKPITRGLVSLAKQVEEHLQLPLYKGKVRVSDWSHELTHEQCGYAASDAYAGLRVFDALERKRLHLRPTPPMPRFAELKLPILRAVSDENDTSDEPSESSESFEFSETDEDDGPEAVLADDQVVQPNVNNPSLEPDPSVSEAACRDMMIRWFSLANRIVNGMKGFHKDFSEFDSLPDVQRLEEANVWVIRWISGLNRVPRVDRKALCAYALWHFQGSTTEAISKMIGHSQYDRSAVAIDIFECVLREELPFSLERLFAAFDDAPVAIRARYLQNLWGLAGYICKDD